MSTPTRYKKDKEIVTEYETQVKGKGVTFIDASFVLPSKGLRVWKWMARFFKCFCTKNTIKM